MNENLKIYEIPNNIQIGVYLLINNDEVVYVGQTKNGLRRIMQHYDKIFNKYSFIETTLEDLDYYEDLYIMKYQPKYNNFYNYYRISVDSCYNKLKYSIKRKLNIEQFIDFIKEENINIEKFKEINTITKLEADYLKKEIEKKYENN